MKWGHLYYSSTQQQSLRNDVSAGSSGVKKRRSWAESSGSYYIPGSDFDPQSRSFQPQELRPRPVTKKAKKHV